MDPSKALLNSPEEGEAEFLQFIPPLLSENVSNDYSDEFDSSPSDKNQLIHCNLLSIDEAISSLNNSDSFAVAPALCTLMQRKLNPIEKLYSLKQQLDQLALETEGLPEDLLTETSNSIVKKLEQFSSSLQITKSSTYETQLESRLSRLEQSIGSWQSKTPLFLMLQSLEAKINLLDPSAIDTIYKKLKLVSIEFEKGKQSRLASDSLEAKVNFLFDKYCGLDEAYLKIPYVFERLSAIEEMGKSAKDVHSVIGQLQEQKDVLKEMIKNTAAGIENVKCDFERAAKNFEERIKLIEKQ